MAQVFRLANKTQTSTYNFLTASLRPQNMTRTPNGDGWITTSMTLVARTTDANIIADAENINQLGYYTDLFWSDTHRDNSIWLEESATSETAKRSLIQSIDLQPLQVGWMSPLLGKTGALYQLTIIHSAAWEGTASDSSQSSNTWDCYRGLFRLTAIDGSLPGRINQILFQGRATSTSDLSTIWGGIRPTQAGDSDFEPLLELELGTLVAPAVVGSDTDNASPVGSSDNIVTYACTTDDVKIDYMTLDDAITSTNYSHYVGDYKVLMRAKLNTAQIVRLHLDYGYKFGTQFISGPYVYTSSTDYLFFDMGNVSIPPFPRNTDSASLALFEFQVYAQRLGTAVTLTIDYLLLIPLAHYFKISGASVNNATTAYLKGVQTEDGLSYCLDYGAAVNLAAYFAPSNWVYPIEGGLLVLAAQHETVQTITDTMSDCNITVTERYRTHGE